MRNNIFKNKQGSTLIIAISMMTILLAGVFSFSKLFSNSVKNSKNLNNKYVSRYASESGIEKVYYLKNRLSKDFEEILLDNSINYGLNYVLLPNNHKNLLIPVLNDGKTYEIILNKTADFTRVKSVKISWETTTVLESINLKLDRIKDTPGNIFSDIGLRNITNNISTITKNLDFSSGTEFILSFTPSGVYKLHNMVLTFYSADNGGGNPVVLESVQGIESKGSVLNNEQISEMTNEYIKDQTLE